MLELKGHSKKNFIIYKVFEGYVPLIYKECTFPRQKMLVSPFSILHMCQNLPYDVTLKKHRQLLIKKCWIYLATDSDTVVIFNIV